MILYPRSVFAISLVLALTACAGKKTPSPVPQTPYLASSVADLTIFPQDLNVYAQQVGPDKVLLSPEQSLKQDTRFRSLFFAAWRMQKPDKNNIDFFKAELARKADKRGFAENLQPWTDQRWNEMELNANIQHLPSMRQPAITVHPANIRLAPTSLPRFVDPARPGQGFPFDEFQQSSLPAGFPLMVFHRSLNGVWLYAESALVSGWVLASDVAFVEDSFRHVWENSPRVVFLRDNVPLVAKDGLALSLAHIGTVLPMPVAARKDQSDMIVLFPGRTMKGWAMPIEVTVSRLSAAPMPQPLTPGNVAALGNRMMEQPYGWGGLFGNRDCSAMMRDLFIPFGVWLPRNSAAQAKAGEVVPLENLTQKERIIRKEGIPFFTLLWLPGHIGLYVGDYRGEPAFFHNIWGLRTKNNGRHILGKAVVTSTMPGKERGDIADEALLLRRMKSMSTVVKP